MVNPANPVRTLFDRLAQTGIDRTYLRTTVLPDWWEDEIALNPAGYAQLMTLLSRCLSIDLPTLKASKGIISYKDSGPARFKKSSGVKEERLAWPKRLSVRALEIACAAFEEPVSSIPESASTIRQTILDRAPLVSLDTLLDYCWDVGIPVLHVSGFPEKTRKMDGLSARINGRPAIVISKNFKYSAWLLFILAHELGHIARGHLERNDVLVDDRVKEDNLNPDIEELEANRFAKEILTGSPNKQYVSKHNLTALNLATVAKEICNRDRIDPGAVALNYAFGKGCWPVGMSALQILEPDANPAEAIRSKFIQRLNWNRLPEDTAEFLRRMTGTNN